MAKEATAFCTFDQGWAVCKKLLVEGDRCSKHEGLVCTVCGAPAIQSCVSTSQFVCGLLLCGNPECAHPHNGDLRRIISLTAQVVKWRGVADELANAIYSHTSDERLHKEDAALKAYEEAEKSTPKT